MTDQSRLTLDLDPALHDRVRRAAARKGTTPTAFCIQAIERWLGDDREPAYLSELEAPLLAELWDNEDDAVYDSGHP